MLFCMLFFLAEPKWAWPALATLVVADAVLTYEGVSTGRCYEINPLMRVKHNSSFGSVLRQKVALQAGVCGVIWGINRVFDTDMPIARPQILVNGVVVTWNLTQVKLKW